MKLELTARLTPPPGKEATLELPNLRLLSAQTQLTTVSIAASTSVTLTPVLNSLRNLTPAPQLVPLERVFVASQTYYGGLWNVRPAMCVASAKVLTVLSAQARRLSFKSTVAIQVQRGELRSLRLRLRDWDGAAVEMSAKGTMRRSVGGERVWTIDLPPGVTGEYRLTLSGSGGCGRHRCRRLGAGCECRHRDSAAARRFPTERDAQALVGGDGHGTRHRRVANGQGRRRTPRSCPVAGGGYALACCEHISLEVAGGIVAARSGETVCRLEAALAAP